MTQARLSSSIWMYPGESILIRSQFAFLENPAMARIKLGCHQETAGGKKQNELQPVDCH